MINKSRCNSRSFFSQKGCFSEVYAFFLRVAPTMINIDLLQVPHYSVSLYLKALTPFLLVIYTNMFFKKVLKSIIYIKT